MIGDLGVAIREADPRVPMGFRFVWGELEETPLGQPRIAINHEGWTSLDVLHGGLTVPIRAEVEVGGATYRLGWIEAMGFPRLVGVVEVPRWTRMRSSN